MKLTTICQRCGRYFDVEARLIDKQKFCGSKTHKTGCSYLESLDRLKKANQSPRRKAQQRALEKPWKKRQRLLNTPYAQRQRAASRSSYHANKSKRKLQNAQWRKYNLEYVAFKNRQRRLLLKALGDVPWKEWLRIKDSHNHRCAICGIPESEIAIKWAGTLFFRLTMDHIRPLSKGGPNIPSNIQPLCVSCNASKRDSESRRTATIIHSAQDLAGWRQSQVGKVVATNGCFDIVHVGHLDCFIEAKRHGAKLLVGLNSDRSVRCLKGCSRPINNQEDRAFVIAAFRLVDAVFIFDEIRADKFLRLASPDVWLKGGGYTLDTLNVDEVSAANEVGSKIVLVPTRPGYSTTETLRRLEGK